MAWPTTNDPKTEFATLRFTVSEMADVDLWADANGMKRSAFIRDCVARCIAADKKKAKRQQASTSKPGGRVDEGAHDE